MNNQHSVHYPSSSDSDTDSVSILSVDDTGEVSYQTDTAYFEEELVFKMENLIEPTTDSVKPPTSNIDHEPPTFSVSSHYPKASNATVMMRSSLFQNKLEDPSMMLSRSLGVYEMGEPFLSSQQALFGTSLPNDLSSITPDWDVNDDKIVVDDEPVEKVPSKAKHKSAEAKIEWPTLEVTQPFDEGTCLNEDLDSLLDNGPLLVDDMKTFHEENDEDPSLTQNSVLGTNVILIGEVPIIGNTYTQDALFAKGVIPEPIGEAENDALAMSTHASNTTINDSTLDEHMIPGILAPNFESNQEWFNVSQNCFFKENTEKPPKRTNRNKPKKQVSFKVYRKATVLKVVGLNTNSIFKDLQRYFYDPSILVYTYIFVFGFEKKKKEKWSDVYDCVLIIVSIEHPLPSPSTYRVYHLSKLLVNDECNLKIRRFMYV
jgi:hypothetical protein